MSAGVDAFKYAEARLALALGISRLDLKFIRDRHLECDVDWKKNGGGEVAISDSGIERISAALGGLPADLDLDSCLVGAESSNGVIEPALVPEKNALVPMTVTKITLNPQMVLAADGAGKTCSVWVGRNENFVVGDKIDTGPHPTQNGFWRLMGPLPRSRRRVNGSPI